MIKTFEQFVSAKYGKPVNEGFQSSKLREIIKQHGLPKSDWDKKMLYDIQDDEVVDVVADRNEYAEKYSDYEGYDRDEAAFMIELEDGSCLVISNLGILKSMFKDRERSNIFKKRHAERHKGNLGKNGGDEIHKKHLEKVDELEQRRFAAKMQPMLSEIAEAIKAEMEGIDSSDLDEEGKFTKEFDITLDGEKYGIIAEYEVEFSNGSKKYGAYYYDIIYNLISFEMWDEEGDKYATNDMLGITDNTYGDLFEPITIDDVEGEIYDHYEYYGVKRSDFY
jgi:hypothetical protein